MVLLLLLCSHSPNDVPPEPQRNVSIAAVVMIFEIKTAYIAQVRCLFTPTLIVFINNR